MDLGDRNSWYCVLDESGQIQLEQRVRTNAKVLRKILDEMPHSALEIGTHSAWINRLLSELGHEVIVANAHKVRLIGRAGRRTIGWMPRPWRGLARIDPALLLSGEAPQRASAGRSDGHWSARRTGAGTNGAGEHGTQLGQQLRRALARVHIRVFIGLGVMTGLSCQLRDDVIFLQEHSLLLSNPL
jgi:hypothetical protein